MANKDQKRHKHHPGQKAGAELQPSEFGSITGTEVDGGAEPDQDERHDDLHDANDHARKSSIAPSAARVGFELASIVRQSEAGVSFAVPEISKVVARLIDAPATTPLDALALAVSATKLANSVKRSVDDHLGEGDRAMADVMLALLGRTLEALEIATGTSVELMSGERPAAN